MIKWLKVIGLFFLSVIAIVIIIAFDIRKWPAGGSIAGIILGLSLPKLFQSAQDILDTTSWKQSQRRLNRAKIVTSDDIIRISFAYLFRIKVEDKYLLVLNARNTEKYQPVGGVYKLDEGEKIFLRNRFQVKDDDKIPIDESSRNDYRIRMESKYLRKFVKRFNEGARRERIDNIGREFKEELIDTRLLNWSHIEYRYCGRYMSDLRFEKHFQMYELLLADVVELMPTKEQELDLKNMRKCTSDYYCFSTAEEIDSLGVVPREGQMKETIADHTIRILQEYEGELSKVDGVGNIYSIDL